MRSIPEAVAEKFFAEADSRTFAPSGMWTLPNGQEMGNWQSALKAYWMGWQHRDKGRSQFSGPPQKQSKPSKFAKELSENYEQ